MTGQCTLFLPADCVPNTDQPIRATGNQLLAIGAELRRPDRPLTADQLTMLMAGPQLPQTHGEVRAARSQEPAIRTERQAAHFFRMSLQSAKALTTDHVPQADGVIDAA